jgi:undecaprenyl-diphosphatase
MNHPSKEWFTCVNGYSGGNYGFASSHAANTFGVAMFLSCLLIRMKPWIGWLFRLWAAFVSYTRIYIGLHYPVTFWLER